MNRCWVCSKELSQDETYQVAGPCCKSCAERLVVGAPRKKVRNPDAHCENCPYFDGFDDDPSGEDCNGTCIRFCREDITHMLGVCGEHPEFLIDAPTV